MLTGELCFPTVSLDRDFIDFGTIHNGKEAVQEFVATNSIKFCVNYKIYILANSVLMETVNPLNTEADSAGALDLLYTSSDTDIHQHAFRVNSFPFWSIILQLFELLTMGSRIYHLVRIPQ